MGTIVALGMAEAVQDGLPLRAALDYHLRVNHYPPVPAAMIPVAERAIRNANRGDYEARVRLPEGVQHARYGRSVPTFEVVDSFHLDAFIDPVNGEV